MPSCWRRNVLAGIVAAALATALFAPAPAFAQSCDQLWHARNSIFAAAGHCFKTPRAVAVFGARCHPPYGRLSSAQQARVNAIIAQERQLGCDGGSVQDAEIPLPPPPSPPPDMQQGEAVPDNRLSEAASVWAATKDSNSPAVLEAFIERFGDTPFGDLARARLDEVKKAAAKAPKPPVEESKPAPKKEVDAPVSTDLCPKYLPSVGRTVQAPCEQ